MCVSEINVVFTAVKMTFSNESALSVDFKTNCSSKIIEDKELSERAERELISKQMKGIFLKPRSKFFFRRSNLAAFEQPLSKLKL